MWRSLARRAWLHSPAHVSKLRNPTVNATVSWHQIVTSSLDSLQSASRLSLPEISHFHRIPRLFSSNSAESYDEPQFEALHSERNGVAEGFSLDVDKGTYSGFDNEGSVFDKPLDDVMADKEVFSEEFDRSDDVYSLDMQDQGVEQENQNDLEKVELLLSLLQSRGVVDRPLEHDLEEINLICSQELLLKVLETPQVLGENLINFFSWVLKKSGFRLTAAMLDSIINGIFLEGSKRESYALWDFVKKLRVKKNDLLTSEILNKFVALFSKIGEGKAAFDVFNSFEELGCSLTGDTYFLTIEALCRNSLCDLACSVCEKMMNADQLPAIKNVGKIISHLCKGGMTRDAHLVYSFAKDKKMNPCGSSVTRLVVSFSRIKNKKINEEHDKSDVLLALELLSDYSAEDRRYATSPFTRVIRSLCSIEDVDRAKTLILEMITSGPPPGYDAFNFMINGLAKAGDMEEALKMMSLMKDRGLKPDVHTYTVMMSGFTRAGEIEKAFEIFHEAKTNHSKLSTVTFHILIRGLCRLEQFDRAVKLLRSMKQHGVHPNHDEYNKLIKSLCLKALDWETAENLKDEMKTDGLILNSRTSALIAAVRELASSQC